MIVWILSHIGSIVQVSFTVGLGYVLGRHDRLASTRDGKAG